MSSNTNDSNDNDFVIPGTWDQDWQAEDGSDLWTFYAEDAEAHASHYAEVSGTGPYHWAVGEAFPEGRSVTKGQAATLENAQQQAVNALGELEAQLAQDGGVPEATYDLG